MRDELYGLKLIQKYEPNAEPAPSDLVSAEFCCGHFRATYAQMTPEERNTMRERHWHRDPNVDTWVYVPPEREMVHSTPNNDESPPIEADNP